MKAHHRVELGIFALALVLRLAWVAAIEVRGRGLFGPDAPSYDDLARGLLAGRGLQKEDYPHLFTDGTPSLTVRSFRPPLLPIVLAGIYAVAGHHTVAARVVMALLGAGTCVVVCRIGRRAFDARTGTVAGLLTAVYPKFVYYAGALVTETLCTLLLAAAVWMLLAAADDERAWWRWAVAGVALALAALTRSSLLAFPALAALWVLIVRPRKARAVAEAALLVAAFAAAMAPWWIRNYSVHGRFVAATTEGGYTFWVTNNPRADGSGHCFWPDPPGGFDGLSEAEIDREFYRRGLDWVQVNPRHFLRLSANKFLRFWRPWPHADEPAVGLLAAVVAGATFIPVLLLALWGDLVSSRRWRRTLLFDMIFLYYTALHMVFMAITRYRLPIEPYLIVLAAWGILHVRRTGR